MVIRAAEPEQQRLVRARCGDREAFAELWREYQPQVLRFLWARRTPAADDVASQVWLEIDRSLERFEGDEEAFPRWLFTIVRRRAIDQERRVRRRGEVPTSSLPDDPPAPGVEERIDDADSLERVADLIGHLKPTTAEVVLLRVVHDMPVAEVAEITGHTETNVRTLVHRGLAQLRSVVA